MSLRRLSLFALSLAALPLAAQAQEEGITGARILACEADRTGENCATLLSQLYVCKQAEEMAGCAELLALRDAAIDMSEREGALNGDPAQGGDGESATDGEARAEDGIVTEPEGAEEIEVEVRAEGELVDELEDEALTEGEERLREEDDASDSEADDATGRPDNDTSNEEGADVNGAANGTESAAENGSDSGGEDSGRNGAATGSDVACPVLGSSDWAAWVNAMPGPDGPSLIVTGVVTLPSPGYSLSLEAGASDRSARPVQVVQLMAQQPAMDAAQVLSEYDVRFEMPSSAPIDGTTAPFTAVRVVCGEQEIARIEPVEVAQ